MTSAGRSHILHNSDLQTSIDFAALDFLAPGTSGAVYAIDKERVLKEYYDQNDGTVERRAFGRLGSHPNIIGYFGEAGIKSIILERGQPLSTPDRMLRSSNEHHMAWIRDAAVGLQYIHQRGIVHADVGCENMVLVENRLKMIDFEGCGFDGQEPTSAYKWYNRRGSVVNSQSDIFAYGCVVYQILTGKPPHHEFTACDNRSDLIERLYSENHFPEVHDLPLGDVMIGCWSGSFSSMGEVITALDSISSGMQHNTPSFTTNYFRWLINCLIP